MKLLQKIKEVFLYFFVSPFTVNWGNWADCYDYGVDKKFFLKKALCQCKHRDYSHRGTSKGCIECSCLQFKSMSNLDWLEYSNERIPQIEALSSKDYYDYFKAVSKGEQTSV